MTKLEFAQAVADRVNGEVREVTKTNGVVKTGIVLKDGTDCGDYTFAATLYVDDFYDKGEAIDDAVKYIEDFKRTESESPFGDFNLNNIRDYSAIKDKLRLRLYNEKTPAELFKSAEKYGFPDLILVPYIQITDEASTKVTGFLLDDWGVAEEQMFNDAYKATKAVGGNISSFLGMNVISNATKTYGAIMAITETDMLDSKFPKGYYLIPSSVHEMLVMPADIGISIDDMNEMVRSVNEAEVKPEEVLSDHVYDFTR